MRIHSPSRHTPHCSLACACTGETECGSSVTTDSIAWTPGKTRAVTPDASSRKIPPSLRLWKHDASLIRLSFASERCLRLSRGWPERGGRGSVSTSALPVLIRPFTLCLAVPSSGSSSLRRRRAVLHRDAVARDQHLQLHPD